MTRSATTTVRRKRLLEPRARQPVALTAKSIGRVLTVLRHEASGWDAPVLTLMAAEKHDPFLTLIGCILSLRTNDKTTAIAAPTCLRIRSLIFRPSSSAGSGTG